MICHPLERMASIALVCALLGAVTPAAACQQWQMPSPFVAQQGNGYDVTFFPVQDGQSVGGRAGYATTQTQLLGPTKQHITKANVIGGISNDQLFMRVLWTYSGANSIGVYIGKIDQAGFIRDGRTHDERADPPTSVEWHSDTPLTCQDGSQGAGPAPQKKFIKHLGKAKAKP